ncbi:MAG: PfkB family carbohydrate kinase [Candidatus Hadarchaeia archaeon]
MNGCPTSLCFGETMLRISTKDNERFTQATELDVGIGGTESNFAIAFSQLGGESAWLSRLPDNFLGRYVYTNVRKFGVDVSPVIFADEGRMGIYYLEMGSDPRPTEVVYDRDSTAISMIEPESVAWGILDDYDLFFTTGITVALSEGCKNSVRGALEEGGEGVKAFFDLNYRSKLWSFEEARREIEPLLPNVDILSVTERDARNVLEKDGNYLDIVRNLQVEYGLEISLMSRGSKGAVACKNGEVFESEPYEIDVVDRVGAGDVFDAAFAYGYLSGKDVKDALHWGVAGAAFAHTLPGDVVHFDREDLERILESKRGSDINR